MNRAESLYEKVKIAQVSLECGVFHPSAAAALGIPVTPLSFKSSRCDQNKEKRRPAGALQKSVVKVSDRSGRRILCRRGR